MENRKLQLRLKKYGGVYDPSDWDWWELQYRIDPSELNWFRRLFNFWRPIKEFHKVTSNKGVMRSKLIVDTQHQTWKVQMELNEFKTQFKTEQDLKYWYDQQNQLLEDYRYDNRSIIY